MAGHLVLMWPGSDAGRDWLCFPEGAPQRGSFPGAIVCACGRFHDPETHAQLPSPSAASSYALDMHLLVSTCLKRCLDQV